MGEGGAFSLKISLEWEFTYHKQVESILKLILKKKIPQIIFHKTYSFKKAKTDPETLQTLELSNARPKIIMLNIVIEIKLSEV